MGVQAKGACCFSRTVEWYWVLHDLSVANVVKPAESFSPSLMKEGC